MFYKWCIFPLTKKAKNPCSDRYSETDRKKIKQTISLFWYLVSNRIYGKSSLDIFLASIQSSSKKCDFYEFSEIYKLGILKKYHTFSPRSLLGLFAFHNNV